MSDRDFNILIIGGGCIGSSIAFDLSRRGFVNTGLIDSGRKTVSATAASGGFTRVFHESKVHVDLALKHQAHTKKNRSLGILGEKSKPIGSLYFFDRRRYRDYEANLQLMEDNHYPFEVLNSKAGSQRFPRYNWDPEQWAIHEPLGDQMSPPDFSEALLNYSKNRGLTLIEDFEVERISHFRDQYRVFGANGNYTAKTLILAGGARILPLVRDLGISLSLKSQPLTLYKIKNQNPGLCSPHFFDRETLEFSGQTDSGHVILSKLDSQRFLDQQNLNDVTEINAPDCYAPNRIGYSGYLMGHPRLLVATGWGGTAFKFSLEVGRRIGDAVESQLSERNLSHA